MDSPNSQWKSSGRCRNNARTTSRRDYLTTAAILGGVGFLPSVSAGMQDGNELFRESTDSGGGTAAVSETGEIVAFGLNGGTTRAYVGDEGSDQYSAVEFVLPGVSAGFSATHLEVAEETNEIVAATIDEDTFGGGNLDEAGGILGLPSTEAEWTHELIGLWDIGVSSDLSTVAAVSNPLEGEPQLILVQEGELAWELNLEDAVGLSVDVSNEGEYVAVACGQMEDGLDLTGQPGIRLYSGEGELLWRHDTDEDAGYVGVSASEELVVGSIGGLSTLTFNLEGNSQWRRDELPTMSALSDDGSTVAGIPPVTVLDTSDGSVGWQGEVDVGFPANDPISLSEDGSRVAVSAFDIGLFVFEEGGPIFEDENEAGPFNSAISSDGSTLASMEVDNDAQSAELVGYRL